MSINLTVPHILFSKGMYVNVTNALTISFVILITASNIMMRESADASSLLSSYYLARLNTNSELQSPQQKVLQHVSLFESISPPPDFAFSYSSGIVGETNNTINSEHNVYIKENRGTRLTSITFSLSAAQMQTIWASAIEKDFFQIKNNFTENCDISGNCVLVTPEHYYMLKIAGNNKTHTVIARDAYAFPQDDKYQKFKSLVNEIDSIVLTTLSQENQNSNHTVPSNDPKPERGFL